MAFHFYLANDFLSKVLTVKFVTNESNKLFDYICEPIDKITPKIDSGYIWVCGESPLDTKIGVTILNFKSQGYFGKTGDVISAVGNKPQKFKTGSIKFVPEINIDRILFTSIQGQKGSYYITLAKDDKSTNDYLVYDSVDNSFTFSNIPDLTKINGNFTVGWKLIEINGDVSPT